MKTTTLYRPAGPVEIELVEASGFRRWPPRLPEQPIFYPVTNEKYAIEITEQWNVPACGIGYVTRFEVETHFMDRYPIEVVGAPHNTEWWIPAEDLDAMHEHLVGLIEVIGTYRREDS